MTYLKKNFKDFVRHNLNEQVKKDPEQEQLIHLEIKQHGKIWVEELIERYTELIAEYDNLSNVN
jgi:hypothetical protein